MMLNWDCETCGRRNSERNTTCILCGTPRAVVVGIPDETTIVITDILRSGSQDLTERFGFQVTVARLGGRDRMTPEEARQLVAETEADIRSYLAELRAEEAA